MFTIITIAIIPVIIWAFMEPLGLRFADLNSITTSIGQILGLVGIVLFSLNLILASKYKFLDKYFKGLDKVYSNHHKFGAIAFSMMLFHPLFLVVKYVTSSIYDAAMFFVPFVNMTITWGIISLWIMIILMALTFYIKIKYHKWKISHKFMTLAFCFSVMHTFFIESDVSRSNLLRLYILTFAFLGIFSIIRKVFYEKLSLNTYDYKVKNLSELNKDVLEIEMEPKNSRMNFTPGQFAFFSFISKNVSSESHPFSIASSNQNSNLKIVIKNFGDFTSQVVNLKSGDTVKVDGPYGGFSYKKWKNKNQIWIAGGIGITPYLSMSRTLESNYNVDLYYCVKENFEAVRVGELSEVSLRNANFRYQLWITKDKGYLTGEAVSGLSNGLLNKDIFLCGPPVFMESLKNQFVALGVDISRIHYENFSL